MKLLPSILTGALIASLIYNIFQYKISRETETDLTHERDSIQSHALELEVQQEILSAHIFDLEERNAAQDLVIQSRELEVIRTQEVSNEYRRKYNSIKFAVLSDSGRLAEIRKLYKSFK